MPWEEKSKYCKRCQRDVLVRRKGTNHILHLLLTIITGGLWLIVWILVAGNTTYYWRIDEVNNCGTTEGTVWSFTTAPGAAISPLPFNGASPVSLNPILRWTAGAGATSHDVYFGTTSPGTFQENQTDTTFTPDPLTPNTTYYWRIDEINSSGTTTGTVCSFTTGYTLTINADTNEGTVELLPESSVYKNGTVVTLTAKPELGYEFVEWTEDLTVSTNPTTLTMDSDKSVTANFNQTGYVLTMSGNSSEGTICPSAGKHVYEFDETI